MCVVTGSRVGDSTVNEHVLGSTFGRRMGNAISVNATSQAPSNSIVCGRFTHELCHSIVRITGHGQIGWKGEMEAIHFSTASLDDRPTS